MKLQNLVELEKVLENLSGSIISASSFCEKIVLDNCLESHDLVQHSNFLNHVHLSVQVLKKMQYLQAHLEFNMTIAAKNIDLCNFLKIEK